MRLFIWIFQLLIYSFLFATSANSNATKSKKANRMPASKRSKIARTTPSFCKLMERSPYELYKESAKDLRELTEWRTHLLTFAAHPRKGETQQDVLVKTCIASCPDPNSKILDFCASLAYCRENCTTAKVIQNSNCMNSGECVQAGCSPMPPRITQNQFHPHDELVRSKIFISLANKVMQEFVKTEVDSLPNDPTNAYKNSFDTAKKVLMNSPSPQNSYALYMPQTMRCLNKVENNILEPIMQNNSFAPGLVCGHAFGLGQVAPETFYSNFGIQTNVLSVQPLKNPCRDNNMNELTIEELPKRCSNMKFLPQFYRGELFRKYAHLTPQQLHNLRTFDVELQIRLILAVIINKLISTNYQWATAMNSYGPVGYSHLTGQDACVQANTLKSLSEKTDSIVRKGGL